MFPSATISASGDELTPQFRQESGDVVSLARDLFGQATHKKQMHMMEPVHIIGIAYLDTARVAQFEQKL